MYLKKNYNYNKHIDDGIHLFSRDRLCFNVGTRPLLWFPLLEFLSCCCMSWTCVIDTELCFVCKPLQYPCDPLVVVRLHDRKCCRKP